MERWVGAGHAPGPWDVRALAGRLRAFVADVSHELRTPLTALRTFNDLLQNGAGEDPATRRDFLAESARQIERLDWLTHNLLDLSRLDAGLTRVVPCTADLAATLRHAVDTNVPAAAARDVRLILDSATLLVPHDPPRLEQAFSNVVSNAIKFSPRGGTVRTRLHVAGERAVVEIDDEGPGIPPRRRRTSLSASTAAAMPIAPARAAGWACPSPGPSSTLMAAPSPWRARRATVPSCDSRCPWQPSAISRQLRADG